MSTVKEHEQQKLFEELRPREDLRSWSDEDVKWLCQHVRVEFRELVIKIGRLKFSLVMQSGIASTACTHLNAVIHVKAGGEREKALAALQSIINILNDFMTRIMKDNRLTQPELDEAKKEVEMLGSLVMDTPTEKGKIILPH